MDIKNLPQEAIDYARAIIECIDDGIFITDGDTKILDVNKTGLGSQKRENIVGKTMIQLVKEGVYRDSVSVLAIKQGEKVSKFQHDETETLVTAIPHIEDGEIKMVVCCERELKELEIMKEQLRMSKETMDRYKSELEYLRSILAKEVNVIVESEEMQQVAGLALAAAKYDSRVLIEGETGVGKEIIAKIIYRNGERKNKPFIAINCSAIPESLLESELFGYEKGSFTGADQKGKKGFFELADKGVLFLDEIGDISLNFQAKLLRVLQENEIMRIGGKEFIPIDVQVIAASNRKLADKVKTGSFRADLFYRLNSFPITIPPLRERRKDIVPLIYSFADTFNSKYDTHKEFSLSSLNIMQQYEWPGNVRELENIVERLVLTVKEDVITKEHVSNLLSGTATGICNFSGGTLREVVEKVEKDLIKKYMDICNDPTELERVLDISRATLNRKITKYGLR